MNNELAEIKGLVEKINPTLVELRSEVDELKTWQGERPADPITQEKWDKMSTDITTKMQEIQDKQAEMKTALERPGGSGGPNGDEAKAEATSTFDAFLRKGIDLNGVDRGDSKFAMEMRPEIKAMSTDVNNDGGYAVLTERASKVITRIFETSPVRQVADVMSGSAKAIELLIDDDEHDASAVGEGASGGETDTAEFGLKTITAHKVEAAPKVTAEMLEDPYFDVESWSMSKAEKKIGRKENTNFILGAGVAGARGIMTYAAWTTNGTYERNKLEQIDLGHATLLSDPDGLIEQQNSLVEEYQPGASWLMQRATYGSALKMKGNDAYHFNPVLLRDGQATATLLGKPVLFCSDIAAVGANALATAYGDFSVGYTVYDRVGLIVLRDPYSSHGYVTFYTTKRTGGDVTSYDAIKIGKIAA